MHAPAPGRARFSPCFNGSPASRHSATAWRRLAMAGARSAMCKALPGMGLEQRGVVGGRQVVGDSAARARRGRPPRGGRRRPRPAARRRARRPAPPRGRRRPPRGAPAAPSSAPRRAGVDRSASSAIRCSAPAAAARSPRARPGAPARGGRPAPRPAPPACRRPGTPRRPRRRPATASAARARRAAR